MDILNYILGNETPHTIKKTELNLTEYLEDVIADICNRMPEFSFITDPRRILVCLKRAANESKHGVFAKIVPMNFPSGLPYKEVKGNLYSMPQILTPHGPVLYIIYFYLPRFLLQDFDKRMLTIIHELYHISPEFDGTIRMFGGKAHGNSLKTFNENLMPLVGKYSEIGKDLDVLHTDYKKIQRLYSISGRTLTMPKAIKVRK